MRKIYVSIALMIIFIILSAQDSSDFLYSISDNVGFAFLKTLPDAHTQALAGSGTAGYEGTGSYIINPAIPSFMPQKTVSFTYRNSFSMLNTGFIDMSMPLKFGVISAGMAYQQSDTIALRGELPTEDPLGYFRFNTLTFQAGYAFPVIEGLHAGIYLRSISEFTYTVSATNITASAGFIFDLPVKGLSLGLSFTNLAQRTRYDLYSNEYIQSPFTLRFGIREHLAFAGKYGISVNADYIKVNDSEYRIASGLELIYNDMLSVRAGYMYNDETVSFSGGLGLKAGAFSVEYAAMPYRYSLGMDNTITVTYAF